MWVVLLDGVGVVRLRGRGARHCEAERPEGVRIPSQDVGLMPRRPRNLRWAEPLRVSKAALCLAEYVDCAAASPAEIDLCGPRHSLAYQQAPVRLAWRNSTCALQTH